MMPANFIDHSPSSPPTSSSRTLRTNNSDDPANWIADTGTTGNFAAIDSNTCINVQPTERTVSVLLPDTSYMHSTHKGDILLPNIPAAARTAHLFPTMGKALLSIPLLCDHGCEATFDAKSLTVKDQASSKTILTGLRDNSTGLWLVNPTQQRIADAPPTPSTQTVTLQANSAIARETMPERIQFLHAALGYPVTSTFAAAIQDEHYMSVPELTAPRAMKYLQPSEATIKGHMDQQRKNLRSTKPKKKSHSPYVFPGAAETPSDIHPPVAIERCNCIFTACFPITGQVYSDLPGPFICPSTSGMKYQLVVYDYDSNAILVEPMRSRTAAEHTHAYKVIYEYLTSRGLRPQLQKLDNEASDMLKSFLAEHNVDFQLTPAGIHRRNAAERAIRTWKNHMIANLCGTDPDFPLELWDKLLPQLQITLNLLRKSRVNPQLSAYAQLEGAFNFNRTPLAPVGTKVIIHEKPHERPTAQCVL